MTMRAMKARGKYTKAAKAMQASTAKHSTLDVGTCSDLDIAKILLFCAATILRRSTVRRSLPITAQTFKQPRRSRADHRKQYDDHQKGSVRL